MTEIYVSTDIEADGPAPGINSMLSLGSAAFLSDKTMIDTYAANLDTLPGASADPDTVEWWQRRPEAWRACRENPRPPEIIIPEYVRWVRSLPGEPVFVAYPAGFDFTFVYWYLMRFAGESPFHQAALDIRTYAMAVLRRDFSRTTKRTMPARWLDDLPHTHVALADAIEQGRLFCNMLAENLRGRMTNDE